VNLRRTLVSLLGVVPVAVALAAPVAAQPAAQTATSVTYQINARHDGSLVDAGLGAPPLNQKWSRDLGGLVSYPIVADGRVFVTAAAPSGRGTILYAVDAATGKDAWAPVDLGAYYRWSALAYGGGRLYALNVEGELTAFDPATGTPIWNVQLPGQYSFTSPPTFADGVVYTGGAGTGGTVYAVDAANGRVLWTQPVENGDHSSPAVTADGVYVSYACLQTYAFNPKSGKPLWHHKTGCAGGGGRTPVLADDGVWVRDDSVLEPTVLNATDGTVRSNFGGNSWLAPAFAGRDGYFIDHGALHKRDSRTLATQWTFEGDLQLCVAPIVVNGYVYVGSQSGQLWAVDGATGQPVWSTNVGVPFTGPDEHNVSQPLTGLGAGGGLVVVPATDLLIAYGR
jgi:outer membrane protein assembly factor BamB